MPFETPFIAFSTGHMIYGWQMHRSKFSGQYKKQLGEKRYMEDYGQNLTSATTFGSDLKDKHSKYKIVVDKATHNWTNSDSARKCKGGLWWATRNAVHVHFYLGGLDMEMVCGRPGNNKSDGITCQELRWIYRFRADAEVQKYIQFWRPAGVKTLSALKASLPGATPEQCGPPWDDASFSDASSIWSKYKPKGKHDINGVPI